MNILICDDHKIIRVGLRQLLQQVPDLNLIEEADSAKEVFKQLNINYFDLILLDISLPDICGLEILQTVRIKYPTTKILMLSMHPQEQYAIRSLKLGASGYLTKDTTSNELLVAIKRISEGGKYISSELAESLAMQFDNNNVFRQKHESLSCREFDIMLKLVKGKSLIEIGNELFISNKTVSTYRGRIMEKMSFKKNTDLTRYCIENNLIN